MFSSRPPSRLLTSRQVTRFHQSTLCPTKACMLSTAPHGQKLRRNAKKWAVYGGLGLGASLPLFLWLYNKQKGKVTSLSPTHFVPVVIDSSKKTGENTKLIRMKVSSEGTVRTSDTQCPIWSVYVKNSDIQIERPYTPLEGMSSSGDLEFWVKSYSNGEMGRWLHARQCGETVEIRGPEQTWNCEFDSWDNIIMVLQYYHPCILKTYFLTKGSWWDRNSTFSSTSSCTLPQREEEQ